MEALPNELILEIAEFSNAVGHARLARTCKRYWNLLCTGAKIRCNKYFTLHVGRSGLPDIKLLEETRHLVYTLRVHRWRWWDMLDSISHEDLIESVGRPGAHWNVQRQRRIKMLMPFVLPNLKYLYIDLTYDDVVSIWMPLWGGWQQDRLLNLKSITIDSMHRCKSLNQLLGLDSLRILCIKHYYSTWEPFDTIFSPRTSKVRILQFEESSMDWLHLRRFLGAFEGLHMFGWDTKGRMDTMDYDPHDMVKALCELHSHSLTALSLSSTHRYTKGSILPSLKSLSKLKWLYFYWTRSTIDLLHDSQNPRTRADLPDIRSDLLDCDQYLPSSLETLFLDVPPLWIDKNRKHKDQDYNHLANFEDLLIDEKHKHKDQGKKHLAKFEEYLLSAPNLNFLYLRHEIPTIETLAVSRGIQSSVVSWRPKLPWIKLTKDLEWAVTFPPDGRLQVDID